MALLGDYSLTVAGGTYDLRVTPPGGSGLGQANVSAVAVTSDRALDVVLP